MIKSMTGYGRGEAAADGLTVTLELRAVNNRYLDTTVKMPRAYLFAEDAIKKAIQARVSRGKLDVFVNVAHTAGDDMTVTVNEPLAAAYKDALRLMADQLELGDALAMGSTPNMMAQLYLIARFPDVLAVEKKEEDPEAVKALLLTALDAALTDFNAMREREGEKLSQDVLSRCETIENLVGRVEERSPGIVADYRARLTAKLQEILGNTQIDESRILTETAIYADKVAVDEETVRLRSHIAQLREMFAAGGAIGRKLDFLIQEFNREANTIGSKCNDVDTSKIVVDIKAEIEKIREQIQNIE